MIVTLAKVIPAVLPTDKYGLMKRLSWEVDVNNFEIHVMKFRCDFKLLEKQQGVLRPHPEP